MLNLNYYLRKLLILKITIVKIFRENLNIYLLSLLSDKEIREGRQGKRIIKQLIFLDSYCPIPLSGVYL